MGLASYAISRFVVKAEVNTDQLKLFVEKHSGEAPDFAAEFPVHEFDNATLDSCWGTSSLPQPVKSKVITPVSVIFTFRTACTPPIRWVTRVSKRYPNLSFKLQYAIPSMVLTGYMRLHGGIRETRECEGSQEEVEEFLLMIE